MLAWSSFWSQPEVDHPRGHPVGHHEDVPAGGLAVLQLRRDLGEERLVVVDVAVLVVDGDAGLLLELLHGRGVRPVDRVEVADPVGEDDRLLLVADRSVVTHLSASTLAPSVPQAVEPARRGQRERRDPRPLIRRPAAHAAPAEPSATCAARRSAAGSPYGWMVASSCRLLCSLHADVAPCGPRLSNRIVSWPPGPNKRFRMVLTRSQRILRGSCFPVCLTGCPHAPRAVTADSAVTAGRRP